MSKTLTRMDPQIKAEWVAALRSGEYRQGSGTLRSDQDEFCCLGVLCDLAVKAGVPGITVEERHSQVSNTLLGYAYGGPEIPDVKGSTTSYAYLPAAVMAWAGLDSENPHLRIT